MSEALTLSSALSALLGGSIEPETPAVIVQRVIADRKVKATALPNQAGEMNLPIAKGKAKAAKVEAKVTAPIPSSDKPTIIIAQRLPKGTYDARAFLKAIGKATTRDEQITALSGYDGYVEGMPLGIQDFNQRTKAQREIRGVDASGPSRQEKRQAQASVAGFVAGMPNGEERLKASLEARERECAVKIGDAEKAGDAAGVKQAQALLVEIRKVRNV